MPQRVVLSHFVWATTIAISFVLAGCKAPHSGGEQDSPPAPSVQAGNTDATDNEGKSTMKQGKDVDEDLEAGLTKGMAYADLRKLLLDEGWEPVKDPQCQIQVVGYDEKTCSGDADVAVCKACTQMPELSAYSGDGYATMRFRHAGEGRLKVVSYGMIEDWSVAGEDSRLRVEEWERSQSPTP